MDKLDRQAVDELLAAVGAHLESRGQAAAIVVVGGSSLAIQGWVERTTRDVDVIARAESGEHGWILRPPDPLPAELVEAIGRVARDYRLPSDWLNTAVGAQWAAGFPEGFSEELDWRRYGSLTVGFAGRSSLIALKLFAAVDQGVRSVHYQDLIALRPTPGELTRAADWVITQDAGEVFRSLVEEVLEHVRRDP
jgi:hypothetical protein